MGKGGPLAFLNKKTWHPGRVQNLEEVWKRQQEAGKEEAKLKEYAKQLQEERAREELASVAEAAGHKIKADRLDWMYQGGLVARQEADQRNAAQEAAAAAGAAAPAPTTAEGLPPGAAAPPGPSLPSFYSEDTPASANEMWQRLHADPLFAIKQQELAARRNIVANPVKMMEIKQQVKELKQLAGGSKKEKKQKKQKKEKHHRKRDRSPSPSSGSKPDAGGAAAAAAPKRHAAPPQPAHQQQAQQAQQPAQQPAQQQQPPRQQQRGREPATQGDGGRRHGGGDEGRYGDARRADGDRRPLSRSRERYGGREEGRRTRSRSRERGGGGGGQRYGREGSRERHSGWEERRWPRSRSRERGGRQRNERNRSHDRSRDRRQHQHQQQPAAAQEPRRDREQPQAAAAAAAEPTARPEAQQQQQQQVAVHMDGASAQGKLAQYGINWASHVPQEARQADRSDFAEQTRKRLEEAARKKEAEEREKAAQRYQRKDYRAGRFTEEEKARRLAEMSGAADDHEAQRAQRLRHQADKEAAEVAAAGGRHHTDTAIFLQAATKDVYGTTKGGSLEDTVGRRAFRNARD